MDKKIAYCGLTCSECEAFLATQNDDQELRKKIAAQWTVEYKSEIKPEDINCVGCTSTEGAHIAYCGLCEIRACGLKRNVRNCAFCPEYACEKLAGFFAMAPAAKTALEAIRKAL
jgi:hypothetical protein